MKKKLITTALAILLGSSSAWASQGVAIQKVITNTRSELGQLASSAKAKKITNLMQKFDNQYQTWSATCGEESFNPNTVSDTCRSMAEQMRETGISLYGSLSDYLPDVAARYKQGASSANQILRTRLQSESPNDLYRATMEGSSESPVLNQLSSSEDSNPFNVEVGGFTDPTEKMFTVLEKLVPDFGHEIPEAVRAGNAKITMMKKADKASYLAEQFQKAKFILESQREYGEIIFSTTKAVSALPKVLGIQYTGVRLAAKPNQKVLDFYANPAQDKTNKTSHTKVGGFSTRS